MATSRISDSSLKRPKRVISIPASIATFLPSDANKSAKTQYEARTFNLCSVQRCPEPVDGSMGRWVEGLSRLSKIRLWRDED